MLGSAAIVATGIVLAVLAAGLGVCAIATSMRATRRPLSPGVFRGLGYVFVGLAIAFGLGGLVDLVVVLVGLAVGSFVLAAVMAFRAQGTQRRGAADTSTPVSEAPLSSGV